jgi:hypothetical protein
MAAVGINYRIQLTKINAKKRTAITYYENFYHF